MEQITAALERADLERLGFRDDDAQDFRRLAAELAARPERLSRVIERARLIRAHIGDFFAELPIADGSGPVALEEGLVTLLALVAVSEEAHADYARRGVPTEIAWHSLADLGQQVHVFRQIFGFLGLCSQEWSAHNFLGRHLWLGRLQFTLEDADGKDVLGVHIPETGALTPESIDDSLAAAVEMAPIAFPDHAMKSIRLHSWILDPHILGALRPDSNLVRFAERFQRDGHSEPGFWDLLFFGFHVEPRLQPVDLSALPQDTSLRRAMRERLAQGDARVYSGYLKRPLQARDS